MSTRYDGLAGTNHPAATTDLRTTDDPEWGERNRQEAEADIDGIVPDHVHHYRGFANTEWALFLKGEPKRIKPLLYVYRVLLTGTHLMRTGEVVAHLPTLAEEAGLTFLSELFERKRAGKEQSTLAEPDVALHQAQFDRLMTEMLAASESSRLPEAPSARGELNDMLVRIRVGAL